MGIIQSLGNNGQVYETGKVISLNLALKGRKVDNSREASTRNATLMPPGSLHASSGLTLTAILDVFF